MFASNRVMCFDPKGKHLTDVLFPARNMACTTWGGPDFDTLYIASGKDRSENAREDDEGGHIFAFKPRIAKGYLKYEFAG
jgi:sugar lactone lactonase YvrE